MADGSIQLRNHMSDLERSVSMLSSQINNAGIIWRDAKFHELKRNISELARSTSNTLNTGRSCIDALNDFQRISEED